LGFVKWDAESWIHGVESTWFIPRVDRRIYKLMKPISEFRLWSGSGGEIYCSRIPPDVSITLIPSYNYSVSYLLTSSILSSLDSISKVLVKPNNTGFIGAFIGDPRLRRIMRNHGISLNPDLQPIASQPSMLAGIVDALIDYGVDEIDIGENMLWQGGTPRAFWETGYIQVFRDKKYRGRVFFVDFYESESIELEVVPIDRIDGYDLGFFTEARPPKALFEEKYDLVIIASLAKIHNCSYYSLIAKNFSVTWNPRKVRWRIHGIPLRIFSDRSYVEELLGLDLPRDIEYKVYTVSSNGRRYAFISNGLSSTSPLSVYEVGGELLAQVDPHHLEGLNLSTLIAGIGYLTVRFSGMYSSITRRLKMGGTKIAGLISGIVGQEGEGPLIYGSRRFSGFALAGFDTPALELLTLDTMFGYQDLGFIDRMRIENRRLARRYRIEKLFTDNIYPWTIDLLAKLTGEPLDPYSLTVTLIDFAGSDVRYPWDMRVGKPFKPSKAFYIPQMEWIRLLYTDKSVFKRSMDYVDKGIEIPLIPPS